jgi:hypothetical protein
MPPLRRTLARSNQIIFVCEVFATGDDRVASATRSLWDFSRRTLVVGHSDTSLAENDTDEIKRPQIIDERLS